MKVQTSTVQDTGKKLAEDLQIRFDELLNTNKLDGGLEGTDITNVVLSSIAPGMTFDSAEEILRDAGFTVSPRPSLDEAHNPNRPRDWFAVMATVHHYKYLQIGYASVYVTLFPPKPGDYESISNVVAKIFLSTP